MVPIEPRVNGARMCSGSLKFCVITSPFILALYMMWKEQKEVRRQCVRFGICHSKENRSADPDRNVRY